MMGLYLGMHSIRLRFLWMLASTQFFWWVNLATSGQAIHEMFLDSNEILFGVYFRSGLVPINEYRFRSHGVQSWLGLIKMLGSDLFGIDFLILQGIK